MSAPTADAPVLDDEDLPPLVTTRRPRRTGVGRVVLASVLVLAAILFIVSKGLGSATVYFKTADEAVAQRANLGTHRFRIEGTVQVGIHQAGQDVVFVIANNGVNVDVVHGGGAPQLFKPGIPVVLEGRFAPDGHFASDRIMVKHTESYDAKHPERATTVPRAVPAPAP